MFFLIVGIFMGDNFGTGWNPSMKWATGIALLAMIWALFSEPGFEYTNFQDIFYGFFGTDALPVILFIIVIIIVIVVANAGGGDETPPAAGA